MNHLTYQTDPIRTRDSLMLGKLADKIRTLFAQCKQRMGRGHMTSSTERRIRSVGIGPVGKKELHRIRKKQYRNAEPVLQVSFGELTTIGDAVYQMVTTKNLWMIQDFSPIGDGNSESVLSSIAEELDSMGMTNALQDLKI